MTLRKHQISVNEALAQLTDTQRFATVLEHGTLSVEIYAPQQVDLQQPHTRDEAYVVIKGTGEFINGESRQPFTAGDFLFVPAGIEHRFVNFSEDLVVWVIFYGVEGGEGEGVLGR